VDSTNSQIYFVEVGKPDYKKAKELYRKAFPKHERVPLVILSWFFRKRTNKRAAFYSIYYKNSWAGFIYLWVGDDLVYVHYLAIDETLRSKGYGGMALEEIKERYANQRIVLGIEEVDKEVANFEQRRKRRDFYKRHGFVSSGYRRTQKSVSMELLVHGGTFQPSDLLKLITECMGKCKGYFLGRMLENSISKKE